MKNDMIFEQEENKNVLAQTENDSAGAQAEKDHASGQAAEAPDCRERTCYDCEKNEDGTCPEDPPAQTIQGKNVGKTCRTHYRGTFNDGTQFDTSYGGEPLEFVCGAGMMIRGFDAAVAGMEVGETVQIHLMPAEAYGEPDPQAIFTIKLSQLPGAEELNVGAQIYLQNMYGQPFPAKVTAKDNDTITFDANHEMAGKELNFTIELVEVLEK